MCHDPCADSRRAVKELATGLVRSWPGAGKSYVRCLPDRCGIAGTRAVCTSRFARAPSAQASLST